MIKLMVHRDLLSRTITRTITISVTVSSRVFPLGLTLPYHTISSKSVNTRKDRVHARLICSAERSILLEFASDIGEQEDFELTPIGMDHDADRIEAEKQASERILKFIEAFLRAE